MINQSAPGIGSSRQYTTTTTMINQRVAGSILPITMINQTPLLLLNQHYSYHYHHLPNQTALLLPLYYYYHYYWVTLCRYEKRGSIQVRAADWTPRYSVSPTLCIYVCNHVLLGGSDMSLGYNNPMLLGGNNILLLLITCYQGTMLLGKNKNMLSGKKNLRKATQQQWDPAVLRFTASLYICV